MKKVDRIVEYKTAAGSFAEVEIKFADGSKATYKGIESRQGNMRNGINRIDEWQTPEGELMEIDITFDNEEMITYKGNNIIRKGTI